MRGIPSRVLTIAGLAWIAALAACAVAMAVTGIDAMARGYFSGWLLAASLPLGALPILMVQDLVGASETPTRACLRWLLASLPLIALLIVPALFDLAGLFPWPQGARPAPPDAETLKGFGRSWFRPEAFGVRTILYLLIWSVLALFFVRPAPASARHRTVAGIGIALHIVIGSLAAFDWWMSLDAPFTSSAYGLVVIAAQATFALAVAALVGSVGRGGAPERSTATLLVALLGFAAFVQFSQYLVIWSANLPREIVWYQSRASGALASMAIAGLPVALIAILALLLPAPLAAMRGPARLAMAGTLVVAVLDLAALASTRGNFTFAGVGLALLAAIVLGGIGAISSAALGRRPEGEFRHG